MAKRSKPARRKSAEPSVNRAKGMATQLLGAQRKIWNSMGPTVIAESLQGGLKKLEEVFDQRVLNALSNAGMPSPAEICRLIERVETLTAEVERLKRKRS
jgi:hypothetical protein